MDDIAPLRQIGHAPRDRSYLFVPVTAYRVRPGNQEGTPLPLDEPQVENAPTGLYIDYYLPDEAHAGRHRDSRRRRQRRAPLVEFAATQAGRSAIGSLHDALDRAPGGSADGCRSASLRLGLSPGDSRRSAAPAGNYTVRLSVNGEVYTRDARVLRDPRIAATDADLTAQYVLARRVRSAAGRGRASRAKAEELAKQSRPNATARSARSRR